jgi:signal transduction histidine kinase
MDRPRTNRPSPENDVEVGVAVGEPAERRPPTHAISHDVREIFSAIQGALDLLQRDADGTLRLSQPQRATLLDGMGRATLRISGLIDAVSVDTSQADASRRVPTDLAALVRRVVKDTNPRSGQTIELDLVPIVAPLNAWQIERVVANLLQNAVRHARRDGTIQVGVQPERTGGLIRVDDDGPGVPDEMRERIFQPFECGPTAVPGMGIGLSLVAAFAHAHGGRAWVEPRAGGGASFRVLLPSVSRIRPPRRPLSTSAASRVRASDTMERDHRRIDEGREEQA